MSAPVVPDVNWTARYSELGTGPVPVEPVISPEYFELERDRVFRRVWLNVCREEEVPNPGDYLVKDIAVTNSSVIVVRGRDGVLRAFHNVCRHRGNKLAWCDDKALASNCKAFSCKFHGWTYNLEGQLGGVPDEDQFFDLDKATLGMLPVHLDTWEGFVFIHLAEQPEETLAEYLGEMGEGLAGYPFRDFSACYRYQADVKVNWKVALDAFQEFYHVAFIHKRSVADAVRGPGNPMAHPLQLKLWDKHRQYSGWANWGYTPTRVECYSFGIGLSLADFSFRQRLPAGVNPSRHDAWAFDVNVLFPNFFVDVFATTYFTYHFWPVAVDRTTIEIRNYYAPPTTVSARWAQEHSKTELRDSLLEDFGSLEFTQQALSTGVLREIVLQDNELLIRHGYKVVDDMVNKP